MRTASRHIAAVLLVTAATGCGGDKSAGPATTQQPAGMPQPAPSATPDKPGPEDVLRRALTAPWKNDWKTFIESCDPESDCLLVVGEGVAEALAEGKDNAPEFRVLMKRHRAVPGRDIDPISLEDPEAWAKFDRKMFGNIPDKTAFLVEIAEFIFAKLGGKPEDDSRAKIAITDVRITGDIARCELRETPESTPHTIHFVRRGGTWYISPETLRVFGEFGEMYRHFRPALEVKSNGTGRVLKGPADDLPIEIKIGETPELSFLFCSGRGTVLAHVTIRPTTRLDTVEAKIVGFRRLWKDNRKPIELRTSPQILSVPFNDENGVRWTLLDGSRWSLNDKFFISKDDLKKRVGAIPNYGPDSRTWLGKIGATNANEGVDKVIRILEATK
jgi:hypothetical protein